MRLESSTAQRLTEWALELGFDRAGVASLGPAAGAVALEGWLSRGDHAGMAYMGRRIEERGDPRRVFDGARSAVCVALQYHPKASSDPGGDLWPGVARYARGRDYHNVMGKRLRKLARRVREAYPGAQTRAYVDTGPVLERELAAAAGLGVPGKNTMLLHPDAGSYFFLGEVLTSLEVEPETGIADLCGSCSRCLEACPTGALPEAYRLDSRRCISYWTIEHRGAIPEAVRGDLGEWVFGCDVCQEACPLNEAPSHEADPAFESGSPRQDLDLVGLLELDETTYRRVFEGSPMQRAGRAGLRRNATLAMGNRGDDRYVPVLARALADPDPVLRSHAAWALGRIGGPQARRALREAVSAEGDPTVAEALDRASEGPPSSDPAAGPRSS
jgi:epoxyqueuosine reductase